MEILAVGFALLCAAACAVYGLALAFSPAMRSGFVSFTRNFAADTKSMLIALLLCGAGGLAWMVQAAAAVP